MIELMIKLSPRFTKEEKDACVPIVEKMVALAELAKNSGLLALEDAMETETNTFLRAALPFIIDSVFGSEEMGLIMSALVLSGGNEGAELLGRLIMAQGVVSLQKGLRPATMRSLLLTMLGEDYLVQAEKGGIKTGSALKAEEFVDLISDIHLQKVLFALEDGIILDIVYFIKSPRKERILKNLSSRRREKISADLDAHSPSSFAVDLSADKMLHVIRILSERGEISING